MTNVQEKAGWGEGQGGSGSTQRGSDVFAGFTICRAFFLLPLVPPICVCCMETESAFVPITRHSAYALQWAHWGGGRNGRKRWAGRLWRRLLAGRHTGAFAPSQREGEMKQREDLEVKANTRLGCFSCLNQECSLRGGTQKSDRCTGKQVPSTAPQVVGGAPQRANPGPACGHFELNSGNPLSAPLPVSREVCPWEVRSGKFPQKWQHDAFWGSASATGSGM